MPAAAQAEYPLHNVVVVADAGAATMTPMSRRRPTPVLRNRARDVTDVSLGAHVTKSVGNTRKVKPTRRPQVEACGNVASENT
jgi:hypothetical protein